MNRLTEYIKGTGWAKLIAVMNILSGAFVILIGIVGTIAGISQGLIGILFGALSIPLGILILMSGIKLWRTASNLQIYKNTEKEEDLKEAIKNLSDYFIFAGLAIAIGLAMVPISIIATLFLGSSMPSPIIY
jgi:divalent metal cation (Fe/Co/Zn/Cd) transporter